LATCHLVKNHLADKHLAYMMFGRQSKYQSFGLKAYFFYLKFHTCDVETKKRFSGS
jgi:hypothetical protein